MQQAHWLFDDLTDQAVAMSKQQIQRWSALKQFYKQQMPYSKPTLKEDIAVIWAQGVHLNKIEEIRGVTDAVNVESNRDNIEKNIIAVVRIKSIGQHQLVTGLVVASEYRGYGLAHTLLAFIAKKLKCELCFVFALPHLAHLYNQHGFNEIKLAANDIQQLYLKHHCSQKPLVLMQLKTQRSCKNSF